MNDEVYDKEVCDKEVCDKEAFDKDLYDKEPYHKNPFSKQGQLSGNGGRSLLDFWLEPEQCLKYQLEMLRHQKLEGILSREILKVDNRLRLSYEITSLIPMAKLLERKEIGREDLLGWLKYIVVLWESLKNFMLDPEGLIMDSTSIYVNPGTLEIYFAYLPLKGRRPAVEALGEWVRGLIINEIRFRNEPADDYVQKLLQLLKKEDLREEDLKNYLRSYRVPPSPGKAEEAETFRYESGSPSEEREIGRTREYSFAENKANAFRPPLPVIPLSSGDDEGAGTGAGSALKRKVNTDAPKLGNESIKSSLSGLFSPPARNTEGESRGIIPKRNEGESRGIIPTRDIKKEAIPVSTGKSPNSKADKKLKLPDKKWLLPGIGIMAVLLLAVLFATRALSLPNASDSLAALGGVALITAGGGYFIYSRFRPKSKDEKAQGATKEKKKAREKCGTKTGKGKAGSEGSYVNASFYKSSGAWSGPAIPSASPAVIPDVSAGSAIPCAFPSSISPSTPVPSTEPSASKADFIPAVPPSLNGTGAGLAVKDLTMLLDQDKNHCPYLAFEKKGHKGEKIPLAKFPFMLGRMSGQVDYVLDNPTVGKMHAEISNNSQGFTVTDMNSRNGTYLNLERIKPSQPVALNDGDRLSLSDESFVFCKGDG